MELDEYLKKENYWWSTNKVNIEDRGTERLEYINKIKQAFKLDRVVCLSGIRRAGKTTLLFQLINFLLTQTKPERIVYVKIDNLDAIENVREIVESYHEITGINPKEERVYFIFDEIHFLKKWQFQLKFFIDSKYKSKFIISGSSKTLLYKEASESLAGRIRFIDVFPLTFNEFVKFNGVDLTASRTLNFNTIKKLYYDLLPKKEQFSHLFNQYLKVGAFPEWFKIKNFREWQKVLVDDYFSLILFKDIVYVFKIKDPILLEKLAKEIALFSTNRFSYLKLSNRLDADRETIKLYLYYLNSSMLTFTAEVYFKTKKARERIEKKIYFWEEGLRRALTLDKDIGKSVENIVAWHLIKRGFEEKPFFKPYYWKNKGEIDFVFDSKEVFPIEVKFSSQIRECDLRELREFVKKHKTKQGLVITKDLLERRGNLLLIPAWLFLLIV